MMESIRLHRRSVGAVPRTTIPEHDRTGGEENGEV